MFSENNLTSTYEKNPFYCIEDTSHSQSLINICSQFWWCAAHLLGLFNRAYNSIVTLENFCHFSYFY